MIAGLKAQIARGSSAWSRMYVSVQQVPRHIAIIMDGNGRWANQAGMSRPRGHRAGSDSVREITRACRRLGVSALTLYAFSEQNWDRSPGEVTALMALLREFLICEREEIISNEIRLRTVGRIDRLPAQVREVLDPLVAETAHHEAMVLTLALSYGGREELTDATREVARAAARQELDPEAVDEALLDRILPSVQFGAVDLMIRTGGEQRISNFLLWACAYAEFWFTPVLWPDFEAADLYEAIAAFQKRDRRFGTAVDCPDLAHAAPGERVHV